VINASAAGANARSGLGGARVVRIPNVGEVALDVCGGRDMIYLQEAIERTNINLLWSIRPVGEYVMFVSKVDDMALDANGGTGNPYPRVADPSNINHLWLLAKIGDDYMIWSAVNNVVLDANGGRRRPYLSDCPNPRNVYQRWELRPVGNDYMLIPRVRRSASNNGSPDCFGPRVKTRQPNHYGWLVFPKAPGDVGMNKSPNNLLTRDTDQQSTV
jgi:hypothetical protein